MRSAELSERVIAVESELIARADAALKAGAPASGLLSTPPGFETLRPRAVCRVPKSIGIPSAHRNVASFTNSL